MAIWLDQVEKARQRSAGLDLRALTWAARDKTPAQLSPPETLVARQEFLRDSLGDVALSQQRYERIIAGNELQDINYLSRGTRAGHSVARIIMRGTDGRLSGYATGFLITPQVLITNHHVLPDISSAVRSVAQFGYEMDIDGAALLPVSFALAPQALFHTSAALDYTVVAVASEPSSGDMPLSTFGCLPLLDCEGKASEGEWLTIIQHPAGERKQICVRENRLLRRDADVLWYSTDTLGGSSGSPVFNNDWYVVALHHCGVPDELEGRIQTMSGRPFDCERDGEQDIRWIANEGIRASRIVTSLRQELPDDPLLQTLFSAHPGNARIGLPTAQPTLQADLRPSTNPQSHPKEPAMPASDTRTLTVTLEIDAAGHARVVSTGQALESAAASVAEKKSSPRSATQDVPFERDYSNRKGFDEDFLGAPARILLPRLSPALKAVATRLLPPASGDDYVLRYHNYSVVMHRDRRFALYSAANVDFGQRYRELSGRHDTWREDPRIPQAAQIANFYYSKNNNKFDRGHLTRREDLEFGTTRLAALQSANDTCHWTNCTPQHAKFNQGKSLWQGLENYLLDDLKRDEFKVCIMTGPVLSEDDPVWEHFKEIQYPVKFWKVVSAVNANGNLFSTAYLLDQSAVIAEFGIEAAPVEPFGAYKTYQTPIAEIERLTQLSFHAEVEGKERSLADFDPLRNGIPRRRQAGVARAEAFRPADGAGEYVLLGSEEDIIL